MDQSTEDGIKLRLKKQHPTFDIPDEDVTPIHKSSEDSDISKKRVYTEHTLGHEEIQREHEREKRELEEEKQNNNKRKHEDISNVDVHNILENLSNMKSLSEINGTQSMAILSYFIEELIWLGEKLETGDVTNREITDMVFGNDLWGGIVRDNQRQNVSENNDDDQSESMGKPIEICKPIFEEIIEKKQRVLNRSKMEMISKSQEALGISLRKSSKIFSNFESSDESILRISEEDIDAYSKNNLGTYEKCSIDNETYEWISRKFYLKTAPKMEIGKYIDRINSNLEISGPVGLCAGWFLFKFVFNLKCNEKLSNAMTNEDDLIELKDDNYWDTRSFPLSLGESFNVTESEKETDDVDAVSMSKENNGDESFSSFISDVEEEGGEEKFSGVTDNSIKETSLLSVNKLNAFRLILTSVRIASKLIEDKNFRQKYYCKVTGLQKLEDLFRLELALGYGLEWGLFTNEYTLWRFLFHIQSLSRGCQSLRERLG